MPIALADLTSLALDDEPEVGQFPARLLVATETSQHVIPRVRGITYAKVLDGLSIQAALGRILPGTSSFASCSI